MKRFLIALFTILLGAPGAWAAEQAESKLVNCKGEAAIQGDLAAAREKARDACFREAVNQVVGSTVTSVSEMSDYTLVRDLVFSQTTGFVSDPKLVDEKIDEASDLLSVKYQVRVAKGEIDKDAAQIATLLAMKQQKRIYIMVRDVSTDTAGQGASAVTASIKHGTFEGLLREAFRKDGFTTLDPNMSSGKLRVDSSIQSLNTPQQARELGSKIGADVVIYGDATATNDEGTVAGVKMSAVIVRVSLAAVTPDSGEVIADYNHSIQASSHSFPQASNIAMRKAADAAVAGMRAKLYEAWRKQAMNAGNILVEVQGMGFEDSEQFQALLENAVRNVKGVQLINLADDTGKFEVKYAGRSKDLAASLSGKVMSGKKMKVRSLTANTLGLALIK